jgi:diguanylate cyclase (GGDEF)-like protein
MTNMDDPAAASSRDAPVSALLRPAERAGLRCALAVLALLVVTGAANALLGFGGSAVGSLIRTWGASFGYVLAAAIVVLRAARIPRQRRAWMLLAIGLSLYGIGNIVWTVWYDQLRAPPIPSISDGLWLSLYPASYVGLVLLARDNGRAIPAGVWLDGIVAGLGFAALGVTVVFGRVLASATGSSSAVVTNLAYPVADLLLAALVVGLLALRGWRLDRSWALLGGGFMLLYVADSIYVLRLAGGSAQVSLVPNLFYLSGVLLLAFAAWQPQREADPRALERLSVLVVPGGFVMTAIALLLYDHFSRLGSIALSLATMTLLAAMVRTALTFRDVRALAATRREATTDELTSLPNRRLFQRTIDDAIRSAKQSGSSLALLILDLDQFKQLNDTLGHYAGDILLRQIGPRANAVLRPTDMLARLGGDEFGILLAAPCGEQEALRIAGRINDALRQPFEVEGLHLHVAASIGIAMFPRHSQDVRQLMRHADVAMYQAKIARSGRELYARDRDTHSRDSLTLASELPAAIASGELEVHFQPKAETSGLRIVGMEALVRWRHPTRGLLTPGTFVALAEQSGVMRDLTRMVLDSALASCRAWREAGHDLHVAVNVSFTDLLDAQFPVEVAAALAHHDVDPATLIMEVTESSVMSDATRIGDVLVRLSEHGVCISLDDFGTGYSSLTHLRTLPVSEVKVDRSFVGRMRTDPIDDAIVRSTIQLAHDLGMRIVAEGVEDEGTCTALLDLDCEFIQGYYVSRPLPPGETLPFLAANALQSAARSSR